MESIHGPDVLRPPPEITAGSILPIDCLRENIPVNRYFKHDNRTGELVPSHTGSSVDIDGLQQNHDFFEVGRINSAVQQLIQLELIEPAKRNLDILITNFTKKSDDKYFLNGIYNCDSIRKGFLSHLKHIYNDHLTLLNLKKLNDSNKDILEQSLDICSLATVLAIKSELSAQEIDTICKGALLINIGRTQVPTDTDADHIDEGCRYLEALGYNETIVNIVRFKSSVEAKTPEPRLIIGIVKASYLYHLSLNRYHPNLTKSRAESHDAIITKLDTYVSIKYLNRRVYSLMKRVFNEAQGQQQ